MRYFAHTKDKPNGTRAPETEWQPLADHLSNVANLAAEFARPLGFEEARVAGTVRHLVCIPLRRKP